MLMEHPKKDPLRWSPYKNRYFYNFCMETSLRRFLGVSHWHGRVLYQKLEGVSRTFGLDWGTVSGVKTAKIEFLDFSLSSQFKEEKNSRQTYDSKAKDSQNDPKHPNIICHSTKKRIDSPYQTHEQVLEVDDKNSQFGIYHRILSLVSYIFLLIKMLFNSSLLVIFLSFR